jgi:hypothetical protein
MQQYIDKSRINGALEYIPYVSYERGGDIHFTALYGHNNTINPYSLIMSSDGNYLKSSDQGGQTIVWDMKKGVIVTEVPDEIEWKHGFVPDYMSRCVMDQNHNYYAASDNSGINFGKRVEPSSFMLDRSSAPLQLKKNMPAICLFMRPQKMSHLCQNALQNSKDSVEELIALRDSKSITQIQGFPRDNLKRFIEARIVELTKNTFKL